MRILLPVRCSGKCQQDLISYTLGYTRSEGAVSSLCREDCVTAGVAHGTAQMTTELLRILNSGLFTRESPSTAGNDTLGSTAWSARDNQCQEGHTGRHRETQGGARCPQKPWQDLCGSQGLGAGSSGRALVPAAELCRGWETGSSCGISPGFPVFFQK